jgi:YbbR domain-containing protein
VTAAGKADNLAVLDTLYADSTVSVEGATESVTEQIRVRKPSELTYLSSDSITVAVEVGPVIRGKTFSDLKVNVTGLSDGLEASVLDGKAAVTINGPLLWVERLRSNSLTLTCDASGLTAGIYSLPVICQVEGSEDQTFNVEVLPDTVQVEIRTK